MQNLKDLRLNQHVTADSKGVISCLECAVTSTSAGRADTGAASRCNTVFDPQSSWQGFTEYYTTRRKGNVVRDTGSGGMEVRRDPSTSLGMTRCSTVFD